MNETPGQARRREYLARLCRTCGHERGQHDLAPVYPALPACEHGNNDKARALGIQGCQCKDFREVAAW